MTRKPTRNAISWKAKAEELEQQLQMVIQRDDMSISHRHKAERLATQRQYELNRHLSITLQQQINNLIDYQNFVDEMCPSHPAEVMDKVQGPC